MPTVVSKTFVRVPPGSSLEVTTTAAANARVFFTADLIEDGNVMATWVHGELMNRTAAAFLEGTSPKLFIEDANFTGAASFVVDAEIVSQSGTVIRSWNSGTISDPVQATVEISVFMKKTNA